MKWANNRYSCQQNKSFWTSCITFHPQVLSMTAALYAASVGLHDVAKFPVWLSMPVVSFIAILYTTPVRKRHTYPQVLCNHG
jgi:4-hydroxybenzoate polyprenyltransferase